ncbi:hypothetical protein [Cupriavidus metallidurans]|uniref:hypothetical protein n=1 Tax=Cupriavidus metallidurans TaxID=119219 RepID=UPI001647E505|nr:hypothetical protein [Cupriavidus metallidurans]
MPRIESCDSLFDLVISRLQVSASALTAVLPPLITTTATTESRWMSNLFAVLATFAVGRQSLL